VKIYHIYIDFTEDERDHWNKKYVSLLKLKKEFYKENNRILFENRHKKANYFSELAADKKQTDIYTLLDDKNDCSKIKTVFIFFFNRIIWRVTSF